MTVTIVPFDEAHIEPAATLLAARHRRDRVWAPALPPRFEDPAATGAVLQELCAQDGMEGVSARTCVTAAWLGSCWERPELGSPTAAWAGMMRPRSAEIPYAGFAADRDDAKLYTVDVRRSCCWLAQSGPDHPLHLDPGESRHGGDMV